MSLVIRSINCRNIYFILVGDILMDFCRAFTYSGSLFTPAITNNTSYSTFFSGSPLKPTTPSLMTAIQETAEPILVPTSIDIVSLGVESPTQKLTLSLDLTIPSRSRSLTVQSTPADSAKQDLEKLMQNPENRKLQLEGKLLFLIFILDHLIVLYFHLIFPQLGVRILKLFFKLKAIETRC